MLIKSNEALEYSASFVFTNPKIYTISTQCESSFKREMYSLQS